MLCRLHNGSNMGRNGSVTPSTKDCVRGGMPVRRPVDRLLATVRAKTSCYMYWARVYPSGHLCSSFVLNRDNTI